MINYKEYYYKYKALKYYLKNRSIIIKGGTNNYNSNQKHEILFSIEKIEQSGRIRRSMHMNEEIEKIYKHNIIPDYLILDEDLDNLKQQLVNLNYKETPPRDARKINDKWWIKGVGLHRFYIRNEIKKYIQNEGYQNIILPEMKLLFYDYKNKEYKNSLEYIDYNNISNEIVNVFNLNPSFLLLLEHVDTSDDKNQINDKAKDEMSKLLSVFPIDLGSTENLYIKNDGKVVLIDVEYKNSACSNEEQFRVFLTKYYGS